MNFCVRKLLNNNSWSVSFYLFLFCTGIFINAQNAFTQTRPNWIEAGVLGGVPQLLGGNFAIVGIPFIVVGAGYGTFPINSVLQKRVSIDNIALGSEFELIPRAEYSLRTGVYFARIYPFGGINDGLFIEGTYAPWRFKADVTADLYSKTLNRVLLSNIIAGEVKLKEDIFSLSIGYQFLFSNGMFFSLGGGVARIERPTYEISVTGDYLRYILLIPSLREDYEKAKREVEADIDSKINEYYDKYNYVPSVFVSIGIRY